MCAALAAAGAGRGTLRRKGTTGWAPLGTPSHTTPNRTTCPLPVSAPVQGNFMSTDRRRDAAHRAVEEANRAEILHSLSEVRNLGNAQGTPVKCPCFYF